jgi:putative endopeptidase
MKSIFASTLAILAIGWASCSDPKQETSIADVALNRANLDTTYNPGDDFFRYSNGGWMKAHPIAADFTRYGSFEMLDELSLSNLKSLFDSAATNQANAGKSLAQIGNFYLAGMDTVNLDKLGKAPIEPYLNKIEAIATPNDLMQQLSTLNADGLGTWVYFYASIDDKDSKSQIASTWQSGLGLPEKDYYTELSNARFKTIREAYVRHIANMFVLAGADSIKAKADAALVLKLETRLAKASNSRLENRDPYKTYNKLSWAEFTALAPNWKWDVFLKDLGVATPAVVNVGQPAQLRELSVMLKDVPLAQWKVWLKWQVIHEAAGVLSANFEQEHFAFYGKTLRGQESMKPRWKRIIESSNSVIGELVGQEYVAKHFPPKAKERMLSLVENLRKSLAVRIGKLEWMSDSTKVEALAKLNKINVKIGYPDKWRDYSNLKLEKGDYFGNMVRSTRFETAYNLSKIGQPVDPTEWGMTPQTVNAYYSASRNEIVFPAGILQPPFFYLDGDDAVNYGAIGVVIGHEITHGFDDQGRKYDKDGNLKEWWTKQDSARFEERAQKVVAQYNNFVVFDSLHVDGRLTLGENIADIGGLAISYDAYLMAIGGKPAPADINGFTHTQRFFLAYSQVWSQNIRDKELIRRLKEDVHSPGEFRVNGALFQHDEFYKAFDISAAHKLFLAPEKRAYIW